MPANDEMKRILEALSKPFEAHEVKWKPAVVSGSRAMAIAYVDARVIQDRLDECLGVAGWSDSYKVLPDGSVICRLRAKISDEWITKTDVGGPSEQPDGGDRMKAAFSDALKRAAVKFGLGRYLYRLPSQWVEYDPQKRRFLQQPTLPAWARPEGPGQPPPRSASGQPPHAPTEKANPGQPQPVQPLLQRLRDYERKLVAKGLCRDGELLAYVRREMRKAGYGEDPAGWTGELEARVTGAAKAFQSFKRQKPAGPREPTATDDGEHLQVWLTWLDGQVATRGTKAAGALLQWMRAEGSRVGLGPDIAAWPPAEIPDAVSRAKEFAKQAGAAAAKAS